MVYLPDFIRSCFVEEVAFCGESSIDLLQLGAAMCCLIASHWARRDAKSTQQCHQDPCKHPAMAIPACVIDLGLSRLLTRDSTVTHTHTHTPHGCPAPVEALQDSWRSIPSAGMHACPTPSSSHHHHPTVVPSVDLCSDTSGYSSC